MIKLALSASLAALVATTLAAQDTGVRFNHTLVQRDCLEIANSPALSPILCPQSGLTLEAWITYDDSAITTDGLWHYPTIARWGNDPGTDQTFLRVEADNNATTRIRFRLDYGAANADVDWAFSAGQLLPWTHIAATWDGSTATLYVNGAQVGTRTIVGGPYPMADNAGGNTFHVGNGRTTGANETWHGEIDELRIWPFARTQAEIQATMNQKMFLVPGRVLSWNLDGFLTDSSSGQLLVLNNPSGNNPFTANTLNLPAPTMPTTHGASTPGCLLPLWLAPSSAAQVGNSAYAPVCTSTPAGAGGVWFLSTSTLPSAFRFLGVDLWVGAAAATATTYSDGLGVARLPLPIPSAPALAGGRFALQAFFLDPCGPQGITASAAMDMTIQP